MRSLPMYSDDSGFSGEIEHAQTAYAGQIGQLTLLALGRRSASPVCWRSS